MTEPQELREIQERMQPGRLTRDGMLGTDRRPLAEILAADEAAVKALGITHIAIGRRLEQLTAAARQKLGEAAVVEGVFEVRVDEARGALPCPFGHPGRFAKGVAFLKSLPAGEELRWTPLSAHMAAHHGFYGGIGSPFRLEPARLAALLRLADRSR